MVNRMTNLEANGLRFDRRKLVKARLAKRMTHEALAAAVGRVADSISAFERGRLVPSLPTLELLAAALDVDIADLAEPIEEVETDPAT
jgi:transcriptional regulator with XRE-family HTH domain